MRLMMAGLDYTTADMDIRDAFSPDPALQRRALVDMMQNGIAGCVLVATCNRTELYLSHRADAPPDCIAILCRALGKEPQRYRRHFVERYERQAVEHLMRVSAGMLSSVPGDNHILAQVRTAIETARDAHTADPFLEALFRAAITAGKKVRTNVGLGRDGASVARRAVAEVAARLEPLPGKRILVVGNGVIGLLAAAELSAKGGAVSVTMRDPRRKNEMPAGCGIVDFSERYGALTGCDAVISATSSPQCTLVRTELEKLASPPPLFVDLAVPRDIEPSIGELPGVTLLNVDHLRGDGEEDDSMRRRLAEAEAVALAEAERFDLWRRNRSRYASAGSGAPDFPIFISLRGAPVLIVGGGRVAARRAEKLLHTGAIVHVVSPEICPEMTKLLERDGMRWTPGPYHPRHMEGATLVIAATNRREVNAAVGDEARQRGILVSVADRGEECTFYFPAIVRSDRLIAGLISNNGDHGMVKRAAARIHGEMEAFEAERRNEDE